MWEQIDPAGIQGVTTAGTALVNQTKTNGVIFRQLGVGADIPLADSLQVQLAGPEPGRGRTRRGRSRTCSRSWPTTRTPTPAAARRRPRRGGTVPVATARVLLGVAADGVTGRLPADRSMTFRLTARDGKMAGGGIGFAQTKVTIAPLAGPFRVTSHRLAQVISRHDHAARHVGRRGHRRRADQRRQREDHAVHGRRPDLPDTCSPRARRTTARPTVTFPDVTAAKARIKVEAIGNVFFDVYRRRLRARQPRRRSRSAARCRRRCR